MSEKYKTTEPDDLMVCLSLMDEHWVGYQNAKGIIRDHAVRMRAELRRPLICRAPGRAGEAVTATPTERA